MKRVLKRIGLWPQEACRYYSAEVIETVAVGDRKLNVKRHEMRQESWVEWLWLKWRKRDKVLHKAW
jgi:hypothetical protein